jgi:hypothetical protein
MMLMFLVEGSYNTKLYYVNGGSTKTDGINVKIDVPAGLIGSATTAFFCGDIRQRYLKPYTEQSETPQAAYPLLPSVFLIR